MKLWGPSSTAIRVWRQTSITRDSCRQPWAVDLQEHLAWVTDELWERLGIQSRQIPDIYLTGNRGLFEEVSRAIGEEVGFEAGYYISRGPRPGIYMRTDFLRSEVRMLLTHEYLHLVLDELAGSTPLPAWLHEGLAKYYEYEFSLQGERPNGARRLLYRNADTARSAALSGALLSLPSLESQADWNSQIDEARIRLQYAEAYMAVRFLTENHGANAPIDIARALAGGARLTDALQGSIALSYGEFQERLEGWLETWEDPTRTQIGEYIRTLDGIMSSEDAISQRRATDLESGDPLFQRVPVKRALVSDAEELVRELRNTPHPPRLESLHDDTLAYLATVVEWLSLELEYAETGMDSRRTQANEMISEIQARTNLVRRAIERERFTFHISNGCNERPHGPEMGLRHAPTLPERPPWPLNNGQDPKSPHWTERLEHLTTGATDPALTPQRGCNFTGEGY